MGQKFTTSYDRHVPVRGIGVESLPGSLGCPANIWRQPLPFAGLARLRPCRRVDRRHRPLAPGELDRSESADLGDGRWLGDRGWVTVDNGRGAPGLRDGGGCGQTT